MSVYEQASASGRQTTRFLVFAGLAAWFALALYAVLAGWLRAEPGAASPLLLVAVVGPPLLFLGACRASSGLRAFAQSLDIRLLVAMQGWRVLGGMFLVLYVFGMLPGFFAFPAGLGDVAIGVTAPWIVLALLRRPAFAASRGFVVWNLLGIFDFVVAVSTGTLTGLFPGLAAGMTAASMQVWPLAMIPGFLVPLFTILHLIAIIQARQAARA